MRKSLKQRPSAPVRAHALEGANTATNAVKAETETAEFKKLPLEKQVESYTQLCKDLEQHVCIYAEQATAAERQVGALKSQMETIAERLQSLEQHGVKKQTVPAVPPANGSLSSRIQGFYQEEKYKLQKRFLSDLTERCRTLSFGDNLYSGLADSRGHTIRLEALPHSIASDLTRETEYRQELEGALIAQEQGFDNRSKIQRLEVEVAARTRNTQDLLDSTELPSAYIHLLQSVQNEKQKEALRQEVRPIHQPIVLDLNPSNRLPSGRFPRV